MQACRWLACACAIAGCGTDTEGLAGGVQIAEATIYQGPAVPLIADGELVTTRIAPVLAGRRGQLHVALASFGDESREVTVQLALSTPTGVVRTTVEQAVTISAQRTDLDLAIEADTFAPDDEFVLSVLEAPGFASSHDVTGGRIPASGTLPLDPRAAPRFHVIVVPTGPFPPTFTPDRVDAWRAGLEAMLPVSGVDLEVAQPLALQRDLTHDAEWFVLLGDLAAYRANTNIDSSTFVFGAVAPVARTTIGGIAASLAVEDPYWRVAAGQMTGGESEVTLINHELGHSIGRSHAPCGNPGGPDYSFPYDGGTIGVLGLDFRAPDQLRDPTQFFDILSYCTPAFVSDYGFGAAYHSLTTLGQRSGAGGDPGFVVDPAIGEGVR